MNYLKSPFLFLLLVTSLLFSLSAGDVEKGKIHYATCVACHGAEAEGNKALKGPRLSGQEGWYIKGQLDKFKKGFRGYHEKDLNGKIMRPMAMILTNDKAVDDVIAYIKTLKPKASLGPVVGGDAAAGAKLYVLCGTCHGPKGAGDPAPAKMAPRLTDQHGWYLTAQLRAFKEGLRGTQKGDIFGMQMRGMSMTLPNEKAVKDVSAYIMSLNVSAKGKK